MASTSDSDSQLELPPPLLRIPLDVRLIIFGFVFPDEICHILCSKYISGQRYLRGTLPGIFLTSKKLLDEAKSSIFRTTTFVTVLRPNSQLISNGEYSRFLLEQSLEDLSTLLASVRRLTLLVSIGSYVVNDGSIFLLHYFRDCLNDASKPLTRLVIRFIPDQDQFGPSDLWYLRPDFAGSQHLRDSCAEVFLAARYIRSDLPAELDIPERLREICPLACRMLAHHYNPTSTLANRPINHFGDHETLIESALKQFYM